MIIIYTIDNIRTPAEKYRTRTAMRSTGPQAHVSCSGLGRFFANSEIRFLCLQPFPHTASTAKYPEMLLPYCNGVLALGVKIWLAALPQLPLEIISPICVLFKITADPIQGYVCA
jgi:hypothetical protein